MGGFEFDPYVWRARVLPMYFTLAPAILAIAATLPEGLSLPLAGASAVVFLPLSYFLSQVGADFGKRREPSLWRSWRGPPATRLLRHRNADFNAVTRERVHARLRELGLTVPTPEEEAQDQSRADELYASAVDELRRRTRGRDAFPLVFIENVAYGFRRNLLGLKPLGLTITLAALGVAGWTLWARWSTSGTIAAVPLVIALLTVGIGLGWALGVGPDQVRIPAERYARQLLEAALDLEAT